MAEDRRQFYRRESDIDSTELYTRVSVLETRFNSMAEQLIRHETDSKELWLKIANTLDDIKEEISSFKFSKFEENKGLENEIRDLKEKISTIETSARASWKVVTVIGAVVGAAISFGLQFFKTLS